MPEYTAIPGMGDNKLFCHNKIIMRVIITIINIIMISLSSTGSKIVKINESILLMWMFLNNESYDNHGIYGNFLCHRHQDTQLLWHFSIMINNNIAILPNSKVTLVQINPGASENLDWWSAKYHFV